MAQYFSQLLPEPVAGLFLQHSLKHNSKLTEEGRKPKYDLPGEKSLIAHSGHALVSSKWVAAIFSRCLFGHAAPVNVISKAEGKSQDRQCLCFCTADFLSLLAYESAEQTI